MRKDLFQSLVVKTAIVLHFLAATSKEAKAQTIDVNIPIPTVTDNSIQQEDESVTSETGEVRQSENIAPFSRLLYGHFIRQKFADLPELADNDPTPGVCVINVDQYLSDGSIALKRVHPQNMIEKRLDEPMMRVECRYGKHDFNFEEAYHNLSDGAKAYYDEAGPIERFHIREQCMQTFNDTANYKAQIYENQLNPRRVHPKGYKNFIRVVRIGTNQANPTCWALEMAAFACHPDSLVRNFASQFVDINDPENKALLDEAGRLLYREDGKLLSGSDSIILNRHEATKKLLQVKVGNICENINGKVLPPTTPYGVSRSAGYRFFTQDCMRHVCEFDSLHHQTFRDAVGQFVRGVYLSQVKNSNFYSAVQGNKRFKIEQVGAHLESCNHYGPAATKNQVIVAAKDCQAVVKKMAHIDYLTMNGIEDLREMFPADQEIQRFYELSRDAVQTKKQAVLDYAEKTLSEAAHQKAVQKKDATNIYVQPTTTYQQFLRFVNKIKE